MEQNYKNHRQVVTGYHKVLFGLFAIGLIGSIINLFGSFGTDNLYSASLVTLLFICFGLLFYYARSFPLRAQDRAIRAEENFRYYILTGKPFPANLRMGQIVALRFASDEEFAELVQRAVKEDLNSKTIKEAIIAWKADHNRV